VRLNIVAVFAPIPKASVMTATVAKPGLFARTRQARRRCVMAQAFPLPAQHHGSCRAHPSRLHSVASVPSSFSAVSHLSLSSLAIRNVSCLRQSIGPGLVVAIMGQ
jgi:hypothetical protein